MRTSNPALSEKAFRNLASTTSERMTVDGTVNKSFLLIALVFAGAFYSWQSAYPQGWTSGMDPQIPVWYFPAIIGAFIIAMVVIFKKTTAPYLAPVYAILEGLALGAISALFEYRYPGIVLQAIFCTIGVFGALLLAYRSGLIKATENFKLGVVAATGGIAIVYLIDLGLRFFGTNVPFLHENGFMGIGISLFIVVVAALNLVLDFDFIEKGAEQGAPKYMEWYAAFGLLVTLVWLYLEILRLLSKSKK
ncbi:Bax inhibitor-1/YccA family protein [bacterium]|nr:Bax inhibitor-1/YccA family protein [bacterium]